MNSKSTKVLNSYLFLANIVDKRSVVDKSYFTPLLVKSSVVDESSVPSKPQFLLEFCPLLKESSIVRRQEFIFPRIQIRRWTTEIVLKLVPFLLTLKNV